MDGYWKRSDFSLAWKDRANPILLCSYIDNKDDSFYEENKKFVFEKKHNDDRMFVSGILSDM